MDPLTIYRRRALEARRADAGMPYQELARRAQVDLTRTRRALGGGHVALRPDELERLERALAHIGPAVVR